RRGLPFEEHRATEPAQEQWNRARDRCRLHAGDRGGPLERALLELLPALLGVALCAEIERDRRETIDVESRVDALRVLQAAQEETGADQGDQRKRDLGGDQQIPEAEQPARSGRRARLLLQL